MILLSVPLMIVNSINFMLKSMLKCNTVECRILALQSFGNVNLYSFSKGQSTP